MLWRRNPLSSICFAAIAMAMACVATESAVGQAGGGNNNNFGVAGVEIDAEGVLRTRFVRDPNGVLTRQRITEARNFLDADMVRVSRMRKISLNRLEAELAELLERGEQPTPEMLNLAGLTSIEYVFYYPESQDIVIAGPAEGFFTNPAGRSIGMHSGKAILRLEDLVVALRAFGPAGDKAHQIGCSIDPTEEGLQRLQQFLADVRRSRPQPSDARRIAMGIQENLGLQVVSVHGISPNTHFAQVLVEADYRMKLIGIGLETPQARITSWAERANPSQMARNAMQRWYFTPDYERIVVSEDDLAMQLVGNGVKLISEDEMVTASGERVVSRNRDRASEAFCQEFTERFGELAENTPVYAQLRNLMDMSIAAAYIQYQDYYGQSGWDLGVLADEEKFPVETYEAPTQVESAVNIVWKGRQLTTPVGGGVEIRATEALSTENMKYENDGKIATAREGVKIEAADGQWWWD